MLLHHILKASTIFVNTFWEVIFLPFSTIQMYGSESDLAVKRSKVSKLGSTIKYGRPHVPNYSNNETQASSCEDHYVVFNRVLLFDPSQHPFDRRCMEFW